MANVYLAPVGVLLGTSETTVYTAPGATSSMVVVRFNNVDTVTRVLDAWLYTGGGPGADATRLLPKSFSLAAGQQLEIGPLYLTAGYKIMATSDAANKISAMPFGIETT